MSYVLLCFSFKFLLFVKAGNSGNSNWAAVSTGNAPSSGWIRQEHTWFVVSPWSVTCDNMACVPSSAAHCMAAAALLLWRSIFTHSNDIEPSSFRSRDRKERKDTLPASNSITNVRTKVTASIIDSVEDAMFIAWKMGHDISRYRLASIRKHILFGREIILSPQSGFLYWQDGIFLLNQPIEK